MDATSRLVVQLDERGRSAAAVLRAEAPLLLRITGSDAVDGLLVHLVGGAAGPLGGDRLALDIDVGERARLAVRSVAASLAQPGPATSLGSVATITATVAAGAALDWWPEPLISVAGSDHTQITRLSVADDDAQVRWVDEVVLGRHGEPSGRLTMIQRIVVAGAPVLHHSVTFDPTTMGIGRHGIAGVAVTGVVLGRPARDSASVIESRCRIVRYPIGASCTVWIALADDLDRARRGLLAQGCSIDELETSV